MENKRKPWIKLTPQEIQNLTNRQCTDCKFYPKSNGTSGKVQRREKRNTDLCFPWAQVQGLASI